MTALHRNTASRDDRPSAPESETPASFLASDESGDQRINRDEFSRFLDELGSSMTETQRRNVFDASDTDHDGLLSMDEFAAWWLSVSLE